MHKIFLSLILSLLISSYGQACNYTLSNFDFHFKNQEPNPSIILLGDSQVRWGNWQTLLNRNDVWNRGISGDRTDCMASRINFLKDSNAKIIFLEGGINNIHLNTTDQIFNNFVSQVQWAKSKGLIPVITTTFIVGKNVGITYPHLANYTAINNKIIDLNTKLVNYAKANNIDYVHINPTIASGLELNPLYAKPDGLHLNDAGYTVWANAIKAVLAKYNI